MKLNLSVVFYPQKQGGFTVICPELNCASEGDSYEDAKKNIGEAMKLMLEDEDEEDLKEAYNYGDKIFSEIAIEV